MNQQIEKSKCLHLAKGTNTVQTSQIKCPTLALCTRNATKDHVRNLHNKLQWQKLKALVGL
jgi:hypothetical protein